MFERILRAYRVSRVQPEQMVVEQLHAVLAAAANLILNAIELVLTEQCLNRGRGEQKLVCGHQPSSNPWDEFERQDRGYGIGDHRRGTGRSGYQPAKRRGNAAGFHCRKNETARCDTKRRGSCGPRAIRDVDRQQVCFGADRLSDS
jgi:hypothetical protein